jgi:hypothetical protein
MLTSGVYVAARIGFRGSNFGRTRRKGGWEGAIFYDASVRKERGGMNENAPSATVSLS